MYSFSFPVMFGSSNSYLFSDYDATLSNLKLLLLSDKLSLLGDPYYGTNLKRLLYEQNNYVLKDLVIDDIYNAIVTFMPQIRVERKNIIINIKNQNLYVSLTCTNMVDYTTNLYEIRLTEIE